MKWKAIVSVGVILAIVGATNYLRWDAANPFDDIVFVKDYPGATDRFVTFTPYLKSDLSTPLCDEPLGVDFGKLSFQDTDGDGIHEAIIETDTGLIEPAVFYSSHRIVAKLVEIDGAPRIEIIESKPTISELTGPGP